MAKKYTSNYNIKDYAINEIAPKYFDKELIEGYNIGTIGYITDIYANSTEDMFNTIPVLMNELFPNTCQFPSTIYNSAAIFGNSDLFASPAHMTVALLINERDVLKYATSLNEDFKSYIIDEDTFVAVGDIKFKLDYDIKITVKPYKGDYIYTAMYDKSYNNELSNVNNPFIRCKRVNYKRTKYLALAVTVRQVEHYTEVRGVLDNSILNAPRINFIFNKQLANFEVFYRESGANKFTQLSKRLVNSRPLKTPFCYYKFIKEDAVEITFTTKENYFKPEYNSEIKIRYWVTDGDAANFDMYTGDDVRVYVAQDSKYEYNSSVPLLAVPQTPSINGKSRPTLEQLKQINTDNYATVTSYTTEADLNRHFKSFEYNYNQRVLFIKKRDDIVDRLYCSYSIFKDKNDYYYKTNTLDMKLYPTDYDLQYDQTGRYILRPGNIFKYDGSSNDTTIPTGNKISEKGLKLYEDYIYTNPYLMTVSKGGVVGYYLNSRNDQIALEYEYINNSSFMQFICNYAYVYRNALLGESTYKIRFNISPTDDDISNPLLNEDGADTGRIRIMLVVKDKSGREIGYTFADLKEYNTSSRMYTFEAELETDDYVNVYEKIRITNLKEMNTGRDMTVLVNMINLDIGIYAFFKYSNGVINHKFSYMDELREYTLTNTYITSQYEKITLAQPLNTMKSTMKFVKVDDETFYTNIRHVPLIKMDDVKDDDGRFIFLAQQLDNQYKHMLDILYDKTNNYSVDMKFFNTYGRSRNFTVDGTEELLNSVNCRIHFRVSLFNTYNAAETIDDMKRFIKDYFEEVNDNGMNAIYISNLIQALENEFDDIKYIKFISLNGYNTFVQCVENNVVLEDLNKYERIAYVPEFLNIDLENITIDLD